MSTSPDAPQGANLGGLAADARRRLWDSRNPGVILLKGLLGFALVVGALVALGMNYEIVWSVLTGTVIPALQAVLDTAEALLDSFYLLVGLGGLAPIATVYTGFVIFLGIGYLAVRKGMRTYQTAQAKKQEIVALYVAAWNEWYGSLHATAQERLTAWWNSLDFVNKVVAATFLVLVGIPIALLLSFVLGSLVANLL
ncbi:MAG: hypothetical protein ACKN9T_12550 [Candidatus Methylumidiphilus sp.]